MLRGMLTNAPITTPGEARALICELGRRFYDLGWVSGTGGGISIRLQDRIFMAPSGVQKEALTEDTIYELDKEGGVVEGPGQQSGLKVSECCPLFFNAFRQRDAGAVIHSHSRWAMLATLLFEDAFRITHLEMIKGIAGHGYHDVCEVPVIENTAHERDLADSMGKAIDAWPKAHAVLVRRHGVYIWGRDWREAKRHAECYDYLFAAAVEMHKLGIDPARAP
jgi:methylthioribulose-1-phosphate dehydratase